MTTLGYIDVARETVYSNLSETEEVRINIYICNTHSGAVDCNVAFGSLQGLTKTAGIPIWNKSMSAGETKEFLNLIVSPKQNVSALAGTADKITIKVDEV